MDALHERWAKVGQPAGPPLDFKSPERAPRQVLVELCGPARAVSGLIALFPERCAANDGDVAVQGVDLVHRVRRADSAR